jgi:Tfp pilus assembly protein PilX
MNGYPDVYPCRVTRVQDGMVLLLCLLFLMSLTLLGLAASSDALLQSKLSANLQDSERARQSALLALSWAEDWLLSLQGPAPGYCVDACDGLRLHAASDLPPHPDFEDIGWWMLNGHEAGVDPLSGERLETITADSFTAPVWIIETLHTIVPEESGNLDLQVWYRILARGTGRTETVVSVVESVVVRSWPTTEAGVSPGDVVAGVCPGSTSPGYSSPAICGRFAWRKIL